MALTVWPRFNPWSETETLKAAARTKTNKQINRKYFSPESEWEVSVGTHEIVYIYLLIYHDLSILALSAEEAYKTMTHPGAINIYSTQTVVLKYHFLLKIKTTKTKHTQK